MTKLDLDWPHNFNEIPKEVFVRKDVYDTELQRIFHGEEWHPVCHESEIPERGDFKTFRLAGIPLLIARGDDGIVRAFFNACLICPLLSGPKLMIFWITKETWNAEQEASPGRDYRQAA